MEAARLKNRNRYHTCFVFKSLSLHTSVTYLRQWWEVAWEMRDSSYTQVRAPRAICPLGHPFQSIYDFAYYDGRRHHRLCSALVSGGCGESWEKKTGVGAWEMSQRWGCCTHITSLENFIVVNDWYLIWQKWRGFYYKKNNKLFQNSCRLKVNGRNEVRLIIKYFILVIDAGWLIQI